MSAPAHHDAVVARHGETEWSRNGRHTGRTDVPLTDKGRKDAENIGPALAQWDFALVLTSPLQRARETCRLAGLGDVAEIDDDLLEWNYGDYEGLTTPQIREDDPDWLIWTGHTPGGETPDEVATRVDRVIERVLAADGPVALFAHGHVLRVLMARWLGLGPADGRLLTLATGTLSVLGWEHEYRVVRSLNEGLYRTS
ncbi:MAG: histidine phosphatase family protein [Acidimicrobiia bacterium]